MHFVNGIPLGLPDVELYFDVLLESNKKFSLDLFFTALLEVSFC